MVKVGDTVIDATCGNGHDSLIMANLSISEFSGRLYCIDIQQKAVEATRRLFLDSPNLSEQLKQNLDQRISFVCGNHSTFPPELQPSTVSLVVYNLGYLPGIKRDDPHFIRTELSTTIQSIERAAILLKEGGLLSITAYPGHDGGEAELLAVQKMLASFDQEDWRVHSHVPLNRPAAPTLFLAFKIEKFNYFKKKK